MATKVESYQSNDGRLFPSELEAVRHEVLTALLKAVPDIRDRWPLISGNVDAIAVALQPLAKLIETMPVSVEENHPEPPVAETTLTPDCTCKAGAHRPPRLHHRSCPVYRNTRLIDTIPRAEDLLLDPSEAAGDLDHHA